MDGGTFEEVRIAMNELGMYEDIVESGAAQHNQAKTAILYSESADIWMSPIGTPGAAKRSLYLALRHAQIPVDVVNEEDCSRGSLNHYAVLFIVDPQVSEEAVSAVAAWATSGGHVFVTAGGAQLSEANQTNVAMQKLQAGITQTGIWTGTRYSRHNGARHRSLAAAGSFRLLTRRCCALLQPRSSSSNKSCLSRKRWTR